MKELILLLFHLLTTLAKLTRPGANRAVIAEKLILWQQSHLHRRLRQVRQVDLEFLPPLGLFFTGSGS